MITGVKVAFILLNSNRREQKGVSGPAQAGGILGRRIYGRITHHTYETRYDLTKVYITLYTFCEGGSTKQYLVN